jgi:outer membrane protein OmpA-like peptidoglycan-associated protein
MKKLFLLFLFFIFHFSFLTLYAQSDTAKISGKNKKAKPYKQGPSYIDANLFKIQRPQDTTGDSTVLKKKLKLKTVDKNIFGPVSADYPPDPKLAQKSDDGTYFEKPHSVAWFTFIAPEDTILTFDLEPSQKDDDLDFLLFKDETGNFEYSFASGGAKPIRSNTARCDKTLYCRTGLSPINKNFHQKPGKYSPYSAPLKVKRGERFFLAVDNYTNEKRPFTLFLHLRWPALQKPPPPAKPEVPSTKVVKVNIIVLDSSGKPAKARLKIAGVVPHKLIDTNHVSKYSMALQHKQRIKIAGIAPGYLLSQSYFTVPDEGGEINDTIRLKQVREHENMVLQDIEFVGNEAAFLLTSTEALSNLLEFMKANPTVHILIKGYVNDPMGINTNEYDLDLSERRAKTVIKYLSDKGIDPNRMEWKGFGRMGMLYPNPKTSEEEQANRRVEIEVK